MSGYVQGQSAVGIVELFLLIAIIVSLEVPEGYSHL